MQTAIVMPAANEQDTIEGTLIRLRSLPIASFDVYVVMDAFSKDSTQSKVECMARTDPRIHLVFHHGSTGVASCYLHGFKVALQNNADFVVEADAGDSHPYEMIPQVISLLDGQYECVWGSRFIKGGKILGANAFRFILSKGGTILANLILHTTLKDMTSGFEGFRADVLRQLDLDSFLSTGHMYQTEMRYYCNGFKSIEIPITYRMSSTTISRNSILEALKLLTKLKANKAKVLKSNAS